MLFEWYKEKSIEVEERYGKKINSLVFQHIIVPEIYDALEKVGFWVPYAFKHIYNKDEYGVRKQFWEIMFKDWIEQQKEKEEKEGKEKKIPKKKKNLR